MIDPSIKVIAFTGKARSGKNEAANILAQGIQEYNEAVPFNHTYVVAGEAFAGPIKSMVAMLLDFFGKGNIMNHESMQPYIDGDKKEEVVEEIGVSPRFLMQTLGTEWGRKCIDQDLWVNCMLQRLASYKVAKEHGYAGAYVFITDCRFNNEAKALQMLGIPIINIVRPGAPELFEDDQAHASERGISKRYITSTVINSGSLEDFEDDLRIDLVDLLPRIPCDEDLEVMWAEFNGQDQVGE